MIRAALPSVALLLGALGAATAGLAFLHGAVSPLQAIACAAAAWGATRLMRSAWDRLPPFVTVWLDAGVALVVALFAASSTAISNGLPYVVARSSELVNVGAVASMSGVAVAALAYTHGRLAREVEAQTRRLADLQQRALRSHLQALAAQINPHFLFNALNTLAEVVHEDEDLAEDLITDLAGMMRYALRSSTRWVTVGEELDIIRRLLRIEAARLGENRLQWSVLATPEAEAAEIPGLLVQPLVENAVHHGVATRAEGGRVEVLARIEEDGLTIAVRDDGPGLPEAVARALHHPGRGTEGAGGGLYNSAERARLAWPGQAGYLRIEPGPGTQLRLVLPRERAA